MHAPSCSSLFFPLLTLGFVATGPHRAVASLPGIALVAAVVLSIAARAPAGAPAHEGASWPFTALAVVLALVQLATLALFVRMVARGGWSWDLIVVGWFVGNNSGWGSLVVAHELIHRRSRALRLLGRALLCTVLYDHFFVEHLRGHHVRVGDARRSRRPRASASRYHAFFRRTVPAQFRSAWRLDRRAGARRPRRRGRARRRGHRRRRLARPRRLPVAGVRRHHRARGGQLLRALGLQRRGGRPGLSDSWDTDSWFTHYTLIGLSRHADHHAHAARPFERLRAVDESPKLPGGYYAMVGLAQMRNGKFRALMTAELRRKKLGPFASRGRAAELDAQALLVGEQLLLHAQERLVGLEELLGARADL